MLMIGLLSAVAFHSHHIQDDTVMDHAVNSSHSGHGIFKDPFPFAKDQVGGNQDRFALIAFRKEGKEDLHFITIMLDIANIVEDDASKLVQLGKLLRQA